jgi:hypothetical protein
LNSVKNALLKLAYSLRDNFNFSRLRLLNPKNI